MQQNVSYSGSVSTFLKSPSTTQFSNSPIQVLNCHRDLGIMMSSDLTWSNHLKLIASRAYKVLGLIRCLFSSSLDIKAKKILYLQLVRSQLTYGSQIWRPRLIKDIVSLERQQQATKYILSDYQSDYKQRLQSLNLLPLVMQLELYDIMFFIRCLKFPSDSFTIQRYVHFSEVNTFRIAYSKSNRQRHFYFNRLPRLWNSLPPINLELSIPTIKNHLLQVFRNHFNLTHCKNELLVQHKKVC